MDTNKKPQFNTRKNLSFGHLAMTIQEYKLLMEDAKHSITDSGIKKHNRHVKPS